MERERPSPQPSLTLLKGVRERRKSSRVVEGSSSGSWNLRPLTSKAKQSSVSIIIRYCYFAKCQPRKGKEEKGESAAYILLQTTTCRQAHTKLLGLLSCVSRRNSHAHQFIFSLHKPKITVFHTLLLLSCFIKI